jgi:hypothetical protein
MEIITIMKNSEQNFTIETLSINYLYSLVLLIFFLLFPLGIFAQNSATVTNDKAESIPDTTRTKKPSNEYDLLKIDIEFYNSEIKSQWHELKKIQTDFNSSNEVKQEFIFETNPNQSPNQKYLEETSTFFKVVKGDITEFHVKTIKSRLNLNRPELKVIYEVIGFPEKNSDDIVLNITTKSNDLNKNEETQKVSLISLGSNQQIKLLRLYRNRLQEILNNLRVYQKNYQHEKDESIHKIIQRLDE